MVLVRQHCWSGWLSNGPDVVTKDVDEFDWDAKCHLGLDVDQRPPAKWAPEQLQQLSKKKQELSDSFIAQHGEKPIVYSGIHNDESGFNVPAANKYLLDTGPLKSTYRAWRRNMGGDDAISLLNLPRHYLDNRELWNKFKEQGYTLTSGENILQRLGKMAAVVNNRCN